MDVKVITKKYILSNGQKRTSQIRYLSPDNKKKAKKVKKEALRLINNKIEHEQFISLPLHERINRQLVKPKKIFCPYCNAKKEDIRIKMTGYGGLLGGIMETYYCKKCENEFVYSDLKREQNRLIRKAKSDNRFIVEMENARERGEIGGIIK